MGFKSRVKRVNLDEMSEEAAYAIKLAVRLFQEVAEENDMTIEAFFGKFDYIEEFGDEAMIVHALGELDQAAVMLGVSREQIVAAALAYDKDRD